jgi:hypothetical protein
MEEERYERTTACIRFDAELMAYLEGEGRPFVAAHARECEFCRVILADLEHIRTTARQLPLEEPSPTVWANIRAVLAREGRLREKVSGWRWVWQGQFLPQPAAVGALACLVILGSFLTMPPASLQREAFSDFVSSSRKTAAAPVPITREDSDLARMTEELELTYRANEKFLAPETKATYEKSLVSLDTSIRECQESLRQEPDNTLAHDYLLTAYTRKAEVLASALEFGGR